MERLILEFTLRATLIGSAAALVLIVLRIRRAATCHAVWTGVLAAMLTLPLWISWGPKVGLPVLPAPDPIILSAEPAQPAAALRAALETVPPGESVTADNFHLPWTALVYLLGAATLLLRLAVGTVRASRLTGADCITPLTVGLLRPRVILPDDRCAWLQTQLDAVLAHENAHARRRDPLVQWFALLNRAIFWFHPLAWWLERKLSALAEEACDAAVLEQGFDARQYSGYLLDLARAVQRAGVRINVAGMAMPGSNLPHRLRKIMDGTSASRASRFQVITAAIACGIGAATTAAVSLERAPQVRFPYGAPFIAQAMPPKPPATTEKPLEFDAASIRPATAPDGVSIGGGNITVQDGSGVRMPRNTGGPGTDDPGRIHYPVISMKALLKRGWDSYFDIKGPGWLDEQLVSVDATMPTGTTKQQFQAMLRNLMVERFGLKYHVETREVTGYALTLAKSGLKIKESPVQDEATADQQFDDSPKPDTEGFPTLPKRTGPFIVGLSGTDHDRIMAQQQTMQNLAQRLARELKTPVADATGLAAKYDFRIDYQGNTGPGGGAGASSNKSAPDIAAPFPDLITAVQSQLGLKLEAKKVPVEIFVVDHIEKTPAGN